MGVWLDEIKAARQELLEEAAEYDGEIGDRKIVMLDVLNAIVGTHQIVVSSGSPEVTLGLDFEGEDWEFVTGWRKKEPALAAVRDDEEAEPLPIHRTEAGYPRCSTCDGGGCPDCTDPA